MSELRVPLSDADHFVGDPAAAVTLVEYGDYQCPYCRAAHPVVINLLKRFGPDVVFAYRHFPLTTIHPLAKPAAEAAEFAGSFGRFWEMHAALYASEPPLTFRALLLIGDGLGLDAGQLRKALVAGTCAAKVLSDYAGGLGSGVTGTPCFFINGRRHEGKNDQTSLVGAIEAARRAASDHAARVPA